MGLAQNNKYNFFGKKLPAWMLLAALVIMGAGAATGLVLKDQITGTTTIAVGQALHIDSVTGSGGDAFLGTVEDDGSAWAAHFEANNGDSLTMVLTVGNDGGSDDIVAQLTLDIPSGISVSIASSDTDADDNIVQTGPNTWKFGVDSASTNVLTFTIAIEDTAATGFYEMDGTIDPLNL